MDDTIKGAWLLAQSKSLDAVNGASRLENIQYAGRAGRLYNLLRRNVPGTDSPTIDAEDVKRICQLNGFDRSAREAGLQVLQQDGRVDIAKSGAISVIGGTTKGVLEATAKIFEDCSPSNDEQAAIYLAEKIAENPTTREETTEFISDTFKISDRDAGEVIDICKSTAILDEVESKGHSILFNNNTFRDGQYAQKTFRLLQSLNPQEQSLLSEVQELIRTKGAIVDTEAKKILGDTLYSRLVGVGLFDRLEVSNSTEAVGYLTSPVAFQKYGRPFEDDPVDDAKALLASLTYGMTRSSYARGNITMPRLLLNKLIDGGEVGGVRGVRAIGEDYKELEKRQVVKVIEQSSSRYTMKLLKKDVGYLALAIITGNSAAPDALLMDGSAASGFQGPAENRKKIRQKHTLNDAQFLTGALDRLRSGG